MRSVVALRGGWLAVVVVAGGVLSQLVGGLVAIAASLVGGLGGGAGAEVPGIAVVGPSVLGVATVLVVTAVIVARLAGPSVSVALGLVRVRWPVLALGAVGAVGLGPVGDVLMTLLARLAPALTFGTLEDLTAVVDSASPLLALPFFALVPAFAEELYFRGMLQRRLGRGARAVLITGCAFALFHLDPRHVVGVLPLALYLSWLAARTGSTWVPIAAHAVNNTLAVLAPRSPVLDVGYGTATPLPWELLAGGLAVSAVATALLARLTRVDAATQPRAGV